MSRKKQSHFWIIGIVLAIAVAVWAISEFGLDALNIEVTTPTNISSEETSTEKEVDSKTEEAVSETTATTEIIPTAETDPIEDIIDLQVDEEEPEVIEGSEGVTYQFDGPTDSISVTTANGADLVLTNAVRTISEEDIVIGVYDAKRIQGTSRKDGSEIQYLLIYKEDTVIMVRGDEAFIDRVIDEIQL